jgi:photosystem II stability/assembly factor-like uncharacterized protein
MRASFWIAACPFLVLSYPVGCSSSAADRAPNGDAGPADAPAGQRVDAHDGAAVADGGPVDAAPLEAAPVAPCPGPSQVGAWENVEPAAFHTPSNMQTVAVAVNPQEGSVFAAASNKTNGGSGSTGIFKSTDCGATWTAWNTGAHQANLATGQLWAMLVDPFQPQTMYVANGYGDGPTLYQSTNGGIDWNPLAPDAANVLSGHGNFVQAVALDRGQPGHLAVTFHDDCGAPFSPLCMSQSTDGGTTWTEFNGPADVPQWQEGATLSIFGPTHYLYGCSMGVWYTSDGGQTWTKVIPQGIFGRYAGSTDVAPDGTAYIGVSNVGTFYSRPNPAATPPVLLGSSWTPIPGSPQATNIIDDGLELIAAEVNGPPFFTAGLTQPTAWTHMPSPTVQDGSNEMAYDPGHRIIYSANFENGLLRLVTR